MRWTCSRLVCTSSSSCRSLNTYLSSCRSTNKHKRQTSPPPPSLPLAPPPPPSPGAHRALPRPSGANDQHRVALAVHRRPLQQLQQMSATQGRRRLHYQDAVPTMPAATWLHRTVSQVRLTPPPFRLKKLYLPLLTKLDSISSKAKL